MENGDRPGKRGPEDLPFTHGGIETKHPTPVEEGQEDGGGEAFSVVEWARNDSDLSKGEVGVDRFGQMLVVREG